jgi:AcrR family transcriptional regulator
MNPSDLPVIDDPADTAAPAASAELKRRALRATRALIVQSGLDVSMEQIAAASGVGRRSLFRHFKSRDALVGEALDSAFLWYEAQLDAPIAIGGPLDEWLHAVLLRIHQAHLGAGRGLWQLASAFEDELPPEFKAANKRRRAMRRRITQNLADRSWAAAGEAGPAPELLVEAMAMNLSSFTTHSMVIDRKRSIESLVRTGVAVLLAVIQAARAAEAG